MKALTVYQPWASLIIAGAKPNEFRGWNFTERYPGLVGQRIMIHAGARPMKRAEVRDLIHRLEYGDEATGLVRTAALDVLEQVWRTWLLPHSSALGTAILGEPKRAAEIYAGSVADSDRLDQHVWAWPLTDIRPFEPPIPAKGAQGFWEWREAA